jgi:serine/threonine protein kinase
MSNLCINGNYPQPYSDNTIFIIPLPYEGKAYCYDAMELNRSLQKTGKDPLNGQEYSLQSIDQLLNFDNKVYYQILKNTKYQLFPLDRGLADQFIDGMLSISDLTDVDVNMIVLGEGAYGTVYKYGSQQVATKTSDDISSALCEYILVRLLNTSPCCIIPFFSLEIDKSHVMIVMKSMSGNIRTLRPTTTADIKNCMFSICNGIYYAHMLGIYHADLKPENILVDADKNYFIADWGLSAWRLYTNHLGRRFNTLQTVWYRSPEVFKKTGFYDYKIDIWSIGIMFLEFIRDKVPEIEELLPAVLYETSELDMIRKIARFYNISDVGYEDQLSERLVDADIINPLQTDPRLTSEEQEFIGRTLRLDPSNRASIDEVLSLSYFKGMSVHNCVDCGDYRNLSELQKVLSLPDFLPASYDNERKTTELNKIIVVDWINEIVFTKIFVVPRLLYLFSAVFDEYYSIVKNIPNDKLQMVAAAVIYVLTPLVEDVISLSDMIWMTRNAYTKDEFIKTINDILNKTDASILRKFPALYFLQKSNFELYEYDLKVFAFGKNIFQTDDIISWIQLHHNETPIVNIDKTKQMSILEHYKSIIDMGKRYPSFPKNPN